MAKKSQIARDAKRRALYARYKDKRAELKAKLEDARKDPATRMALQAQLQQLPRNSSPTRLKNRCSVTGRSRAYMRKFGVSRIVFREMANRGELPGVRKSSW